MDTGMFAGMEGLAGYGVTEENLKMLENFIGLVKFNYSILEIPKLKFFRDWLVNDLKATIPDNAKAPTSDMGDGDAKTYAQATQGGSSAWSKKESDEESAESSSSSESELEVDMEGVVSGDTDPPQEMGDDKKVPTDEEMEEASQMRSLGMEALGNGDCEGAIKHFTAGILLNNKSTVLFVKRATAFLRLTKPNAATRDAKKALEINPDSAAAYKVLGKALRLLGQWEEACHSFEEAQKIDYDPDIIDLIKEVKPKATKIREHKIAAERKRLDKEDAARLKRVQKAKKAQEKARKEQEQREKEAEEKFRQEMPGMFNFAGQANMPGAGPSTSDAKSKDKDDAEPKIFEAPDDIDLD